MDFQILRADSPLYPASACAYHHSPVRTDSSHAYPCTAPGSVANRCTGRPRRWNIRTGSPLSPRVPTRSSRPLSKVLCTPHSRLKTHPINRMQSVPSGSGHTLLHVIVINEGNGRILTKSDTAVSGRTSESIVTHPPIILVSHTHTFRRSGHCPARGCISYSGSASRIGSSPW